MSKYLQFTLTFGTESHFKPMTLHLIAASGLYPTEMEFVQEGSLSILIEGEDKPPPILAQIIAKMIVRNQMGGWVAKPFDPIKWSSLTSARSLSTGLRNAVLMKTGIGFNKYSITYDVAEDTESTGISAVARLSLTYIVLVDPTPTHIVHENDIGYVIERLLNEE